MSQRQQVLPGERRTSAIDGRCIADPIASLDSLCLVVIDSASLFGGTRPMAVAPSNRIRFGVFELDSRSGELYKGTRRVLLQEQPFQVLRMLVEAAGELVSRDEIQHRLWPNDTIVEFDTSISTAIKKLRK